jgi:hypothetical protein
MSEIAYLTRLYRLHGNTGVGLASSVAFCKIDRLR